MTWAWRCLVVVSAAAQGCVPIGGDADAGLRRGAQGESCGRTADCQDGLACVALTCVAPRVDASAADGARRGGLGDNCLRTADCQESLRCIQQRCAVPADGGPLEAGFPEAGVGDAGGRPDGGGRDGSSRLDAATADGHPVTGTDAGLVEAGSRWDGAWPRDSGGQGRGEGCADPGAVPRGTGGCCRVDSECVSGQCLRGFCTAVCSADDHCAVTAPTTPFAWDVPFSCRGADAGTGTCVPGSWSPCGDHPCPTGESCALVAVSAGDVERRCVAQRVGGNPAGAACEGPADCAQVQLVAGSCVQGACRQSCGSDGECPPPAACVRPPASGADGPGLCLGAWCGDLPTGTDARCGGGLLCAPSERLDAPGVWEARCRPPAAAAALPVGTACLPEGASRCDHRVCAGGACSVLCRTDDDCPSSAPYCDVGASPGGRVAACVGAATLAQACGAEADCGILGCVMLGSRSRFSHCAATGHSHANDTPCDRERVCPPGALCLPDVVDGTWRCARQLPVGSACESSDQCRSGPCLDRDGRLASATREGTRRAFCSARCRTSRDCAPNMACRTVLTEANDPADPTDDVLQPLCWPLTPPVGACLSSESCYLDGTGDTCDETTGACHTREAPVGAPCQADWDCARGIRCGSPAGAPGVCVRDGCIPGVSGGGCDDQAEICVPTSPITAECRRACDADHPCEAVNPGLSCHGATDGVRGTCVPGAD